jgi:hypothetical protein
VTRMSNRRITSTTGKGGERVLKGLLSKVERIGKLKAKAVEALLRRTLKKEKEDEFLYQWLLPAEITDKRKAYRHVTRIIKGKTYKYLELPVHHNYTWNSESILDVVLDATIRNSCIEDASYSLNLRKPRILENCDSELTSRPTGDTVLRRIKKVSTAEWMERFEKANHDLLMALVKARAFAGFVWVALDVTPWMFYGDKNTSGVMGTQRQKGSNYAFKYMTVCVTAQREHVTLAGSYMTQLMDTHTLMKELIVKSQPYISGKMGVLCDREFFTVEYIKVLYELNRKFLMPARKNKRIKKIIKETKDYPRVVKYSMGRGKDKVEFWLFLVKTKKGEVHAFATNVPVDEKNAEKLAEFYRNRWAIETSYSMLSEVRARTCSTNFALRWFFVLFGLLVRNGYYLFNEAVIHCGHITLKTFAELTSEVKSKDISQADDNPIGSNKWGDG